MDIEFYTYSNPMVSKVFLSRANGKKGAYISIQYSEYLRLNDILASKRAVLYLDDTLLESCIAPYDECPKNTDGEQTKISYSEVQIDGDWVQVTGYIFFDNPQDIVPLSSIMFAIPSNIKGAAADLAQASANSKNAYLTSDMVEYRFRMDEFVDEYNGNLRVWSY